MSLKYRTMMVMVALFCFSSNPLYGDLPRSVEITTTESVLVIGEPLVLRLSYTFEGSQLDSVVEEILGEIAHSTLLMIEVKDSDRVWLGRNSDAVMKDNDGIEYYPTSFYPISLGLEDSEGREYGGYSVVFLSPEKFNSDDKRGIIFEEPGTYKIRVRVGRDMFSSVLNIQVLPEGSPTAGRCVLSSDPNDYFLLMGLTIDGDARSVSQQRLESLIDSRKDALFGQWAAARLGLQYYVEEDTEKVKARLENREVDSNLFDRSIHYLSIALDLPDEFWVRQEVLYRLTEIHSEKKDFAKAIQYVDELAAKYPRGRRGRNALKYREELQELQARQSQSPEGN